MRIVTKTMYSYQTRVYRMCNEESRIGKECQFDSRKKNPNSAMRPPPPLTRGQTRMRGEKRESTRARRDAACSMVAPYLLSVPSLFDCFVRVVYSCSVRCGMGMGRAEKREDRAAHCEEEQVEWGQVVWSDNEGGWGWDIRVVYWNGNGWNGSHGAWASKRVHTGIMSNVHGTAKRPTHQYHAPHDTHSVPYLSGVVCVFQHVLLYAWCAFFSAPLSVLFCSVSVWFLSSRII